MRIPASGLYLRDSERGAVWHRPAPTASAPWSPAPLSDELDALCVVPWDIVEAEQWSVFEFYTQRGCSWGRCRFCSVADRNIRALSPRKVNEVVRAAAARGLRTVSFADDLFIQRTAWNTELLALLEDPVIPGLEFRAQTIANRSVWPHLEQMARVGFRELAFGIETFSPRRTELWLKSFRGETYIAQAKETVVRTAQAGILPEIYLILADPTSTLAEIAWELAECVELLGKVFAETGVLPRASFTLALLPVAGVPVTDRYPYRIRTIPLAHSKIDLPDEFRMPAPVGSFLAEADLVTGDLPYRRENLEAFFGYFDCLEKAASDHESDAPAVEHELRRARTTLTTLCAELDLLAGSLAERMLSGEAKAGADIWSDYRRFGGYIKGVQTLARSLTELSASSRE
ncbi:radical SAM protein [Nonomuraea thailandensis]